MPLLPIYKIQGALAHSEYAGSIVTTQGVVTGISRRGFFIQDVNTTENPPKDAAGCSHAIFVFYRGKMPPIGVEVALTGKVVDYVKGEPGIDKPVTQLHFDSIELRAKEVPLPKPIILSSDLLVQNKAKLAEFFNAHEAMLFKIEAGAELLQPSNPFGDYVVAPLNMDMEAYAPGSCVGNRGGYTFTSENMECWLPGFRTARISDAPLVNVGDTLKSDVIGPMYFRSSSYQMVTSHAFEIERKTSPDTLTQKALKKENGEQSEGISVMTVNCLNLDPKIERADFVQNAQLDIDDDIGDLQFMRIARDIVELGVCPDVVALQEIQDNDGAEITEVVDASLTYLTLIDAIIGQGGAKYSWVDIPPVAHEDGGQPGGNIRNGFLFREDKVSLVEGSLQRLGEDAPCFEGSRKPLVATFVRRDADGADIQQLEIINLHLASKRRQRSLFALQQPGFDLREAVRVAQADIIYAQTKASLAASKDCYVTGDFNDLLGSKTLDAIVGDTNVNLVDTLPASDRYDYNHRGKLHVLMHGIVHKHMLEQKRAFYEILHGNELRGIRPGTMGNKASDHAYVIAQISS